MNIRGNIVTLRVIEQEDLAFLQKMMNDSDIELMTVSSHFPVSMTDQQNWYSNWDSQKELRYIIERKDGVKIGTIMLTNFDWKYRTACMGIKSLSDVQVRVKNDIYEASMLLLQYAFEELNLHMVTAEILEYNKLSRKLALKCGLLEEAVLRDRVYKLGRYNNIVIYSIKKEEFILKILEEKGKKNE